MFDTSKLRGRIVEKFGTQGKFAKAINKSSGFVSGVMNGKNFLEQREIEEWANALDIPYYEIPDYFFTRKVHEMEQV